MATNDVKRRRIGTIVEVNAGRFLVEMAETAGGYTLVGFDGQHYAARIGSLVLIPLTNSYVVAEVVGLQERPDFSSISSASKSIDDVMHASSRQLTLSPLGTLPFDEMREFSFGVTEFPPLYADVLHVENRDLDRILNVANQEIEIEGAQRHATRLRTLTLGTSVIFNDYDVKLRINEFFGAHSAILGNTGSGKSCTISSLLQEALGKTSRAQACGSTFVLFDTNGEYRRALSELPDPIRCTYARIKHTDAPPLNLSDSYDNREEVRNFVLPHWLLTLEEWELLLQASDRVQRPILRTALGLASLFGSESSVQLAELRDHILASCLLFLLMDSENATAAKSRIAGLLNIYKFSELGSDEIVSNLVVNYGDFEKEGLRWVKKKLKELLLSNVQIPSYKNSPFKFADLTGALELAILYEESHGNRRVRDNCSTLLTRVKSLGMRDEFAFLCTHSLTSPNKEVTVGTFVNTILGIQDGQKRAQVYILDLSTVDDEVVEVVSAVVTRMLFERLRKEKQRSTFPVNLILEEAHRYVSRQTASTSALDATRIFERVAKEGRKYGLFLMVSSQRPSELSGTVLSQCSNYIVHRIQNPEDLQHLRRMTPFISEAVLNRLASLPKQFALVFGTAVSIPTTFKVRTAFPTPESDDTDISSLWYQTFE